MKMQNRDVGTIKENRINKLFIVIIFQVRVTVLNRTTAFLLFIGKALITSTMGLLIIIDWRKNFFF